MNSRATTPGTGNPKDDRLLRLPVALTIAGSDSGGGAGIQADLKAFAARRVFGTSAITCLTAQNPTGVTAIEPVSPKMVTSQIEAVFDGFPVDAVKTGMLYSEPVIMAICAALAAHDVSNFVLDPVMIATSGARLLREDAVAALRKHLFPLCRVVTPNLPEAEILSGMAIHSFDDQCRAALEIASSAHVACVVKGGHFHSASRRGETSASIITDILADPEGGTERFDVSAVATRQTHGTGCTFSAALAAGLACGASLSAAVGSAQAYVARALKNAIRAGEHRPLGWE